MRFDGSAFAFGVSVAALSAALGARGAPRRLPLVNCAAWWNTASRQELPSFSTAARSSSLPSPLATRSLAAAVSASTSPHNSETFAYPPARSRVSTPSRDGGGMGGRAGMLAAAARPLPATSAPAASYGAAAAVSALSLSSFCSRPSSVRSCARSSLAFQVEEGSTAFWVLGSGSAVLSPYRPPCAERAGAFAAGDGCWSK